ncbi:MAG TPA: HPr(Ser) kinase/phosphatase [Gammaproteobacteria bacterium]|nr:HPr(Ser) kinase/phosphatase [Gammaproteobacteria bacterium]
MNETPTVQSLFEALRDRLGLRWVTGKDHGANPLRGDQIQDPDVSLAGYLNLIHPHRIQVIGASEFAWLRQLRKNTRLDSLDLLFSGISDLVIMADGQKAGEEMLQRTKGSSTPIWSSTRPSQYLVEHLQYHLGNLLAKKTTLHGVFMEIMGVGVLIAGDASIGKSELALELVARGHRLVADDAPEFARLAPDILNGRCPPMLEDFLEVRGLGILNIRSMFGDSAIKQNRNLRLIIRLEDMSDSQIRTIDRLQGSRATRTILGVDIPEITLPVAPGRNLAVLAEAAVRNHLLYLKGRDASAEFIARQTHFMDNASS